MPETNKVTKRELKRYMNKLEKSTFKDEEKLKRLLDLYYSGKLLKDIGKEFNVSKQTISSTLQKIGVSKKSEKYPDKPTKGVFSNDFAIDEAVELYKSGMTFKEIAMKLGTSRENTKKVLSKLKVKREFNFPNSGIFADNEKAKKLIVLYKNGVKVSELTKIFNASAQTIGRVLYRFGLIESDVNSKYPNKPAKGVFSTDEAIDKLIEYRNANMKLDDIAEIFNVSETTISNMLCRFNYNNR